MDNFSDVIIRKIYELGYKDGVYDEGISGISHLKPQYKHHKDDIEKIKEKIKEKRD